MEFFSGTSSLIYQIIMLISVLLMLITIIICPITMFISFWSEFKKEEKTIVELLENIIFSRSGFMLYILFYVTVTALTFLYYRFYPFKSDNSIIECIFESSITVIVINFALVFLYESAAYIINGVYKFFKYIKGSIIKMLLTITAIILFGATGITGMLTGIMALQILFYSTALLLGISLIGYINNKLFNQISKITGRSIIYICVALVGAVEFIFIFGHHMIMI